MKNTACNQDLLEIPQKGVIYTEDFYQTDQDAEAALNEFRHDSASEVLYKAYSRFYTVDTHAAIDAGYTVGFKADKHELFPFPEKVTRVNNVLVQNKGWN